MQITRPNGMQGVCCTAVFSLVWTQRGNGLRDAIGQLTAPNHDEMVEECPLCGA
jgi:hypothetical protein